MTNEFAILNQSEPIHTGEGDVATHGAVTSADIGVPAPKFGPIGFAHEFTRIPVQESQSIHRAVAAVPPANLRAAGQAPADMTSALNHASADPSGPLDETVRQPLEQHLGYPLDHVRVHQGTASAQAAEQLGARAYTLGNRIYLGSETQSMSSRDRARLLAHEAVHTVQQGGAAVTPRGGLAISSPGDATEVEAKQIADSFDTRGAAPASRSLALRDALRGRSNTQPLSRSAGPRIQRDLTDKYPTAGGEFKLNLKTESHPGAKSGMSGTIKFNASDKAPDSNNIRLLQVARLEDLTTGKDYVWTGGEANRNKVMTTADKAKGIEGGYFVDQLYGTLKPRTKKTDPAISPYYIDYGNSGPANNYDGSKKGKTVKEASLWDYPGWTVNSRFSFETVAKGADTGHVYGTVMWGFTISDASKGKVEKERAVGRDVTLLTTDKAIENYNKFFRNPGSSTAP